jgi:hypothetical protein
LLLLCVDVEGNTVVVIVATRSEEGRGRQLSKDLDKTAKVLILGRVSRVNQIMTLFRIYSTDGVSRYRFLFISNSGFRAV